MSEQILDVDCARLTPTIGLAEAAVLLRCHPDTVRKRASARELPGTKIGRAWVFDTKLLLEWLEARCKSHQIVGLDPGRALAEKLRSALLERARLRSNNDDRGPPARPITKKV